MLASVHTDGASSANPGPGSYGCWVSAPGRLAWGVGVFLGERVTNNEAEYEGVAHGLHLALELLAATDIAGVVLATDSELVVKQLTGEYACREPRLVPLLARARALLARAAAEHAGKRLTVQHVRRESNTLADRMAALALESRTTVASRHEFTSLAPRPGTVYSQNVPPAARPVKKRRA